MARFAYTWHAHSPNGPNPIQTSYSFTSSSHAIPTYVNSHFTQLSPHAAPHTKTAAITNIDTAHPTVPTSFLTADPVDEAATTFVLDADVLEALAAEEPAAGDVALATALALPEICGIGITGTVNVA